MSDDTSTKAAGATAKRPARASKTTPKVGQSRQRKQIKLALQGGGSHGAFTWGVLDAILMDGRLDIEAISGASAGAMNAVVMADGLMDGGPEAACRQLEAFWQRASIDGSMPVPARRVFDTFMRAWGLNGDNGNPFLAMLQQTTSPYTYNPLNINPLVDILKGIVDFDRLRTQSPVQLYIGATNVETGKPRVFRTEELTAHHLAASACLPLLFRSVEIDGVPYWDGGYSGNPPLYPLFRGESLDVLLVQINPIIRPGIPRRLSDIQQRINEISFNGPLLHELRAIEFVARLIETGVLKDPMYRPFRMHRLAMSDARTTTSASKTNTEFRFLKKLRDAGRKAAKQWLVDHFDDIGRRGTLDVRFELA